MEFTVKTWRGYNYSVLKPGCAEGSELKMQGFGQISARSMNKTPILCTDPFVYERPRLHGVQRAQLRSLRRRRVVRRQTD